VNRTARWPVVVPCLAHFSVFISTFGSRLVDPLDVQGTATRE
jgi:hypothetical protein